MSKAIGYCILVVSSSMVIAFSAFLPRVLGNDNILLNRFVEQDLIGVLGVILAITLASSAQLHLTFNQIEESYKSKGALKKSRAGVHQAAYWLIGLFCLSVLIVLSKWSIAGNDLFMQSLFNGAALVVLLWNILILVSIVEVTFGIEPKID